MGHEVDEGWLETRDKERNGMDGQDHTVYDNNGLGKPRSY